MLFISNIIDQYDMYLLIDKISLIRIQVITLVIIFLLPNEFNKIGW